MRTRRSIGILTVLATMLLVCQTASAQQIRNYGSQAEQQYGTAYEGSQSQQTVKQAQGQQPAAQQQPAPGQQQQAAGEEGGEGAIEPSYVTVFRPGGAQAPLPVDLSPDKMYQGVIPGTRDEVTHLTDAKQKGADRSQSNRITWIGFQARDDSTRIFFQTARNADYSLGEGAEGAITLTFNDTKLSARNFGRFVDTSFFDRNVTRIEVDQVDKSTVVATLMLRQYERPDIDRDGNYLYLDFSHTPTDSGDSSSGEE